MLYICVKGKKYVFFSLDPKNAVEFLEKVTEKVGVIVLED